MKVGYVGSGKLGMPVAAIAATKHEVSIFEMDFLTISRWGNYPFEESADGTRYTDINSLMKDVSPNVKFVSHMDDLASCDIIFVAVQTPHETKFEGVTPTVGSADFNYQPLKVALQDLSKALAGRHRRYTVVLISTVLPGTYYDVLRHHVGENIDLVYNPYFIAMGSVIPDFLNPEFILVGTVDGYPVPYELVDFYTPFRIDSRIRAMDITSAEATKMFYNTFITMKLCFANTVAEACMKVGADADKVMDALKSANKRLISTAYLDPGMGDGGGCHPRDNIALSHFAHAQRMNFDFFGMLMKSRDAHAKMLADMIVAWERAITPCKAVGIVGYAFKKNTNITTGSHARLVAHYYHAMTQKHLSVHDAYLDQVDPELPGVYLIGCNHDYITDLVWPRGSVVLDPWGMIPDQLGVTVVRIGRS